MRHNSTHSTKKGTKNATDQRRSRSKKKNPKNKKRNQPIKVKAARDDGRKYAKRIMEDEKAIPVAESTESLFSFQPNPLLAAQTAPLQLKLDISAILRDCSDRVAWRMVHGEEFSSVSVGSPRIKCH